ncbi:MAG TPA: hypothetical protein VKT82_05780 [Ktedonobacterales bacterium]|nr:hypothetical protein [Ktedonobacterales bacterium]
MSQSDVSPASAVSAAPSQLPDTRLHGRWPLLARIACIVVTALALGLFFVTLPTYFARLNTPCLSSCSFAQLSVSGARALQTFGLSLGAYAVLAVAVVLLSFLPCVVVAAVLLWRASDNWVALLVAVLLVFLGISTSTIDASVLRPVLGATLAVPVADLSNYLGAVSLPLIFALFPSGRFVPRWTRWLVGAMLVAGLFFALPVPTAASALQALTGLLWGSGMLILAGAQIYRYRRVSTLVERQQTKWVVFAFLSALIIGLALLLPELLFPLLRQSDFPYHTLWTLLATFILTVPTALAFGQAILRYRLWEIDTLINRALVYGSLTVLLGALYAGLIIGLESLAALVTGQASDPVVLVISTLAIAALFTPVRHRIQAIIDRRFYRRKYDAEKTLAAFSATLRNEVDLAGLRAHLLAVVQETMQPAHVSLWLRQPERQGTEPPL